MHREAVVAVLDVGLTGHGVEVGLQGELQVVLAGLYLQVRRENVYSHIELIFDLTVSCCSFVLH